MVAASFFAVVVRAVEAAVVCFCVFGSFAVTAWFASVVSTIVVFSLTVPF